MNAPWILFEAGSLAKDINSSRVVPVLFGVDQVDVEGPLAMFQSTASKKDDIMKLISSINSALDGDALASAQLDSAFEIWWPRLDEKLRKIEKSTVSDANDHVDPPRTDRDIFEETLNSVRYIQSEVDEVVRFLEIRKGYYPGLLGGTDNSSSYSPLAQALMGSDSPLFGSRSTLSGKVSDSLQRAIRQLSASRESGEGGSGADPDEGTG